MFKSYSTCSTCNRAKIKHTSTERSKCSRTMQAREAGEIKRLGKPTRVALPDYNRHNHK